MKTLIVKEKPICLSSPKRGHRQEEYEDAYANENDGARERFAIADGASESSYARLWAKLLVDSFVQSRNGQPYWLEEARRAWSQMVDHQELRWYAEAKRELGAFATFLGFLLEAPVTPGKPRVWRSVAVGDACLFQIRQDALVSAFPMTRAQDFSNQPNLLCSREGPAPQARVQDGHWEPGDRFLLMTDALGQWFLTRHEARQKPWRELTSLRPPQFAEWVEQARQDRGLRNDDVTLARINV